MEKCLDASGIYDPRAQGKTAAIIGYLEGDNPYDPIDQEEEFMEWEDGYIIQKEEGINKTETL